MASSTILPSTSGIEAVPVKRSVGFAPSAPKFETVAAAAPAAISRVQDTKLPRPAARPVFHDFVVAGR